MALAEVLVQVPEQVLRERQEQARVPTCCQRQTPEGQVHFQMHHWMVQELEQL